MTEPEPSRHDVREAMGLAFAGVVICVWASCGYPTTRRFLWELGLDNRPGHGCFAFDDYSMVDTFGVVVGLAMLGYWCRRLVLLQQLRREFARTHRVPRFASGGALRSVYELLLGVAARDGHLAATERDAVDRLITRELPARVLRQDMDIWAAAMLRPRGAIEVAAMLAKILDREERHIVLGWCREIAAGESRIVRGESELLRSLRDVLGKDKP